MIAGEVLTSLALLLGAYLRRNQRLLLANKPTGVAPTPAYGRLSLALTVDRWRFLIAAAVTFITFLASFWALVLGAGEGLLW